MSDTPRTSKGSVRHALGLDRGDRAAAWLIVALLAAAIVGSAVFAVTRIVTIAQGVDVPVTLDIAPISADVPIAGDGTTIPADVHSVEVTVPELTSSAQAALTTQTALLTAVNIILLGCMGLFTITIIRGHAFAKGNVAIMWSAASTLIAGWVVGLVTDNWVAASVLDALGISDPASITVTFQFVPLLAAVIISFVAAAMSYGRRIEKDVDGLV